MNEKSKLASIPESDADAGTFYLERLEKEALDCLDTFPGKVIELNDVIEKCMPNAVKSCSNANTVCQSLNSRSITSTVGNFENITNPDYDVTSYYSMSTCDRTRMRGRTRRGICKRRFRNFHGRSLRRRPGPLGQILGFLASRLVICTKTIVLKPSWYIVERLLNLLMRRHQVKNAECGPSTDWFSSMSAYVTAFEEDNTTVGNIINIMRPAAVQLIADTTTLKRWLQASAITSKSPLSPSTELVNATRITETIDCWAYELFFHLKYFKVNHSKSLDLRNDEKVADYPEDLDNPDSRDALKIKENVADLNLWHRMVQLRDNYIILYETLHGNYKFN